MTLFSDLFGLVSIAGMVFQAASAAAVKEFTQAPVHPPKIRPPITVLKPLCGADPGLESHLAGLLRQGYPELQVVCGVAEESDPAVAVVHRVMEQFPQADIELVIDPSRHGANLKIGNLLNMLPASRHDMLVIADSDVAAPDGYLDQAVAPFADPDVGLVTFLYTGHPLPDLPSRLGAMGINHGFLPSVLVGKMLGRHDGCFGATTAISARFLNQIGGLAGVRDMLADDWGLGALVRKAGRKIAIAARPAPLTVAETGFSGLFGHEVRWGRTIATIDRPSYMGTIVTQPVVLAALAVLLGGWWRLPLLAGAVAVRIFAVRVEERALALPTSGIGVLLLRDILSFVVFIAACCGRTIIWRGRRYRVERNGRMTDLEGRER